MLCQGKGILAIWHNLAPGAESDYREWHTREHMPERISVPGFLRGCRYIAVNSSPRIFNFYQTEVPQTLTSQPYLERLNNPSPWTAGIMPHFRDMNRSAGRVAASIGAGEGGAIATLRCSPNEDQKSALETWLTSDGLQQTLAQPGIAATHLWIADASASQVETTESRTRGGAPAYADWTIAIEGNDIEAVEAASVWLRQRETFTGSMQSAPESGTYQLQFRIGS